MNNYSIVKQLGVGSFGVVRLATSNETGETVAIKEFKQKYFSWQEVVKLPEVKSLRALRNHENIVQLMEVFREKNQLFLVFEFMQSNLYDIIKTRSAGFSESDVRNITYKILQGLAFMHRQGYFHRDLKPENILCSGLDCIKLADFGLAKEVRSRPPFTEYVSTRWYRAPEILFRSRNYNSPVDMWAVGAMMAELYTLRAIFPGTSEIDQIYKVSQIIGQPTKETWAEGLALAKAMRIKVPAFAPTSLATIVSGACTDGIRMISDMLKWDPKQRLTAPQALARHYFRGVKSEPVPEKVQPVASRTTRSGSIQTLGQSTPFTKPVMATMPRESYQTVTKKQPAAPRKRENSPHDSDDEFDIDWCEKEKKPAAAVRKPPTQAPPEQPKKETGGRLQWRTRQSFDSVDDSFDMDEPPPAPKVREMNKKQTGLFEDMFRDRASPQKPPLVRKDSTLSALYNMSSSGADAATTATSAAASALPTYYRVKSRYTPVSPGDRIPRSNFVSSDPSRVRPPRGSDSFQDFLFGAGSSSAASAKENKWRSRPSFPQLDMGQSTRSIDVKAARSKNDPGVGISVGKSSHRTNWAAKYGGKK